METSILHDSCSYTVTVLQAAPTARHNDVIAPPALIISRVKLVEELQLFQRLRETRMHLDQKSCPRQIRRHHLKISPQLKLRFIIRAVTVRNPTV